ncbi:replication-relaxation family protein [Sphingomonas sp. RT2P30]|uniref:replication-relaxation family protein n=1 Tax=Parasphingomonas halimpatiens TaxID=3096162 RepID=UPI002FC7A783
MKTDQLNRRLRSAPPNALIRKVVLTGADYIILEAINRHGPLPTHYLYQFTRHLRRDYTHLQNRLTEFYNGDANGPLLLRPPQQFAGFNARYQHVVYDLAPRAKALLAERGITSRYAPLRTAPFLHQLMQACVGASFELTAPSKGLRYIPRWEILTHPRCPQETKDAINPMAIPIAGMGQKALIPDELFGLEYPGVGFRFFAVEVDRNTESIERRNIAQNAFGTKIAGYLDILRRQTYRTHWGLPNLHVLTVTTNATHARNILAYIKRLGEPQYSGQFAFASEPSFGANWRVPKAVLSELLEEPWVTTRGVMDIGRS